MTELFRTTSRWGRVPAWWLLHPDVDADLFCVLAALATYANEHGVCAPSQVTLAQRLRRSRPWVNRVVAQLAAAGFLEKKARARGNGGTTSCLYRLRLTPPDNAAPDGEALVAPSTLHGDLDEAMQGGPPGADVTGPASHADTLCQAGDTNQLYLEQNNTPAPRACAPDTDMEVPSDWEPNTADKAEALRLCPGADLPAHTARFRARCRARGYRYRTGRLSDAWLAWLLEDHGSQAPCSGKGRQPTGLGPFSTGSNSTRRQPPSSPALRFAAWAAAAATPPAPALFRPASPWS